MYRNHPQPERPRADYRWRWFLFSLCALAILLGLVRARRHLAPSRDPAAVNPSPSHPATAPSGSKSTLLELRLARPPSLPAPSAEDVVAGKLVQFARSRRELAVALARRHGIQVPAGVERFFAAVESGKWDDIKAAFEKLDGGDAGAGRANTRDPDVNKLWPAIMDAFGAAEQVHLWPAQELLDYGNTVLGALRPGMVYVGGTDNGRWIPELLNDTSDGERHVIVTQNGLASGGYLDYLRLQYDGRLAMLSNEDSQSAFSDYIADATKRLEHDQQFPDEPKQVRPGENISVVEGKVQVGGRVAVMLINEKLLQMLMDRNPDLSFALEESYPLKTTYGDALPLGPLMELRAAGGQNPFTSDLAAQSLDYWRNAAQAVLSDSPAAPSSAALTSYAHDASAAANLLAAHSFSAEAEEAYRLAAQLNPESPEPVLGLAGVLGASGRANEARQLLDDFARKYPDQRQLLEQGSASLRGPGKAPAPKP